MDRDVAATIERRIGGALEPVIGQVYFAPEAHQAYHRLGFDPSPGEFSGVAAPEPNAYFTSRGSLMGQVRGEVVAAAFGVFNPAVVVPAVQRGWTITDATAICAARDEGALGQLSRVLGPAAPGRELVEALLRRATADLQISGRPLAAGITALEPAEHEYGVIFRLGDLLREYRGDSHTAAWTDAGLDAIELGLLTELYWGLPLRSYSRTRGWSDDDFDAAEDRLRSRDLITVNGSFTESGRRFREQIEVATDRQMSPVMQALGDDAQELVELLAPWGASIRAAKGYPQSGPHELAERALAR